MKQLELSTLIQSARAGNPQAQETLVLDIQDRVYYHCKKMMKNESDAQDAAQDVLIAVLTSLDKLKEPAAFYGWVNGITANRCKHLLTRGKREWQIPEDEDGGSMLDDLENLDQQAVPEAVLDDKETKRLMLELIDALPPDQRMCVLFYYYDEMSVKEIAQAMETSEGTVKSRLNYARRSIKAGVEDLEKRGTKLYGVAPLPLLLLFLRMEAAQSGLSAAQSAGLTASVLSVVQTPASGGTAAGSTAGGAAAKAGTALAARIVAVALAVVVTAGAVFAATQLLSPGGQEKDLPPAQAEEQLPQVPELPEEPEPEEPPQPEGPPPELLAVLGEIVYYGDLSQCRLTPEQALAFAAVLREEIASVTANAKFKMIGEDPVIYTGAALFDVGDGTPALFFGGGAVPGWMTAYAVEGSWSTVGTFGIWQYADGQAVPYAPEGQEPGGYWGQQLALRDGSLFIGGYQGSDGTQYDGGVYPLAGAVIPAVPQTSAGYAPVDLLFDIEHFNYQVDGAEAGEAEFETWRDQWEKRDVLCGHYWDGGVGGSFTGLGDAAAAAAALERYAAGLPAGDTDSSQTEAPAYARFYAQKVRELLASGPADCRFDLIDVDGDGVPELVASYPDHLDFYPRVNLYTAAGGDIVTLKENLTAGLRGSGMYYYPGQNAIRLDTADLRDSQWTDLSVYYQITGEGQLKQADGAPAVSGEPLPLEGTKTGEQMLETLEP